MRSIKVVLPLVASVVIAACGGGGASSGSDPAPAPAPVVQSGYFIDSGVDGLNYVSSPSGLSGVTSNGGRFDFKAGDTVTFYIGNVELGSAQGAEVVTPLTLAGTDDINNVQANNISRLLITLDDDDNPDNGITISEDVRIAVEELSGEVVDIDFESDDFLSDAQILVDTIDSTPAKLVTQQEAKEHLQQSLTDTDADGEIDILDTDDDNDGVSDTDDAFPLNSDEDTDSDGDGIGNNSDDDIDGDGVNNDQDDLPLNPNETVDTDGDGLGNNTDPDDDNDDKLDHEDDCPLDDSGWIDANEDGQCNAQDIDTDGDGIYDEIDNCYMPNPDQTDMDGDGIGDDCDEDIDGDGINNGFDNCHYVVNPDQADTDGDVQGDICDKDDDNDNILDTSDNCPLISNIDQLDTDSDQLGNVCDADDDNDEILDTADNCPLVSNADQLDTDEDQLGDACDDIEGPVVTLTGEISNGTINPSQSLAVETGEQVVFTVMPDNGYHLEISGCGGELSGDTFTTAAISEDCVVSVSFTPWMIGERYQVFGNGSIIRDVVKGLEWARCVEGTSWDSESETCIGDVLTRRYTASYGAASDFQGPSGFRLPTIEELRSLVYCSSGQPAEYDKDNCGACDGEYQSPTIHAEAFPSAVSGKYWSSSALVGFEDNQEVVDFSTGAIGALEAATAYGYTRLVRRVDEVSGNGLGFPNGFPVLLDKGGFGKGTFLTGRGGDLDKTREQHRQVVADSGLRPVIYIHGNTGHAYKEYQDMKPFESYLNNAGYQSSHIWAVSYLGMGSTSWQRGEHVYATNIEDIRQFIDAVMEYLDVDKVDLIGHSLGTGMIRGYINGWTSEATFDAQLDRSQNVGSAVLLAGINRGVGTWVNSVYGVDDADAQNNSSFETGNASREAANGVNYYCAYSSYDKYEYHYKDQFWLDNGSYGDDPGEGFHSITDFISSKNPAPAMANPNYISGITTGYTGDLDAAAGTKNFGYTGFDLDSQMYGASLSYWYDSQYYYNIPTLIHMSLVNNEAVVEWFGPYLNQ